MFALVCTISMLAGCENQEVPETPSTEATALTEDEILYFNGDAFFNGDNNFPNQFLTSFYDKPEDIDLIQLFYNSGETWESVTEEERTAIMKTIGQDVEWGIIKISSSNMNKILLKYMGITLEETNKIGLDSFTYLPEYDAYYSFHNDTNLVFMNSIYLVEHIGDSIRLYYTDCYFPDKHKVVTLKEHNGSYLFVSHQPVEPPTDTN